MPVKEKIAAFASLAALYFSPINAQTLDKFLPTIRARFPDVRHIPARTLATWLEDTNAPGGMTLIDVREAREYAVSHLRGALNCPSVAAAAEAIPDTSSRVVVYFST